MSNEHKISRRDFIKVAAAAGLLTGCSPALQQETALASTVPPAPTDTPVPAVAPPQPLQKAPGRVVRTHHAGVWDGDALSGDALRQMLDVSIVNLTGIDDAGAAWAALFDPGERIAIKVNAVRNASYWTHVPLVMAVTECLQDTGVPAEQIIIFDRTTTELTAAGFTINEDGPGVRCYGANGSYTGGWRIVDENTRLSNILLDCDALINIPIIKAHSIAGISLAMKNHYGSLNNPRNFHRHIDRAVAGLNALPPIQERTRLIVGDALNVITTSNWHEAVVGDSIIMSFDPVAHDRVGMQVLTQAMDAEGVDTTMATNMGIRCLEAAAELGLGINEPDSIQWIELNL